MFEIFFYILIALNVADIVTTKIAFNHEGARELNPLMNWLFDKIGIMPSLIITKVIFLAIVYSLKYYSLLSLTGLLTTVVIACSLYVGILINNLVALRKLSKLED